MREYLTLLEALQARVVSLSIDDFYALARLTLVKDEQHYDRFDLAFASYFKGVEAIFDVRTGIPEDWLRREFERVLTDEQKREIEALGGWDKLMETFRQRLEEQRGPARRRQEMDRHRRNEPVRRLRLQPRRHPRRTGAGRGAQRGQGLGRARFPQPRRRRRDQHP